MTGRVQRRHGPEVSLRPASTSDWALIDAWLSRDEVKRWWGSHAAAQAAVLAALDQPMGLCSIITGDGRAIGYAHALEVDAEMARTLGEAALVGCYRIDVLIGERDYRGRGCGVAALRLIAAEVFATTLVPEVISVVGIRNEAAVRAHESAQFAWSRIVDDPLIGPCWLMRLTR